ncbi:Endonuclease MUS81 [Trachipleistophora hominis]|uniref:Crossover junction endonuclease MUS81 n=1 Tax=Trachipleistophora hominis TaxID=72359 RepID=L7JXV8_TRAHO|nr:Endonuclease MUS81 [Trachipleistophora hominis]
MNIRNHLITKCKKLLNFSKQHNFKTRHVLNKILSQLEEKDEITWEEFINLKYVGPKTLPKFAIPNKNQTADAPNETANNKNALGDGDTKGTASKSSSNNHKVHRHQEKTVKDETTDNSKTGANRSKNLGIDGITKKTYNKIEDFEYVPGFNTIAYNILKILSSNDGLCKSQIYLSSKFLEDEISGLHIWCALKTLLQKNLIQKENKRYFLTYKGTSLCVIMFDKTEKVLDRETNEVVLLVDSREMKSKNDRGYFERKLPGSRTLNLVVGDFLWIKGEYVVNTIIERKKGSDFVSSLYDGRFVEQKNRLKNTGLKSCVYLIEGLRSRDNFIESAIFKTKLEGFTVIETRDIEETVLFVRNLDDKIRKYDASNHETCEFASVSSITFYNFSNQSLKTKDFSQQYLLYLSFLSIKGISHLKAKFLCNYFQTFDNLVNECKDVDKLKSILSEMRVNGQLLGKNVVENILHLIT